MLTLTVNLGAQPTAELGATGEAESLESVLDTLTTTLILLEHQMAEAQMTFNDLKSQVEKLRSQVSAQVSAADKTVAEVAAGRAANTLEEKERALAADAEEANAEAEWLSTPQITNIKLCHPEQHERSISEVTWKLPGAAPANKAHFERLVQGATPSDELKDEESTNCMDDTDAGARPVVDAFAADRYAPTHNSTRDSTQLVKTIQALPKEKYLDMYLTEVYKQYIFINLDAYKKSKKVFDVIFNKVKKQMELESPYFRDHGKEVLNAGSVHNHIKVTRLDEFDMDLVIRLPVKQTDIAIESDVPAYIRLKMGKAFEDLKKQEKYQILHDWKDEDSFMLQDEFRHWMHSIVARALAKLGHEITVEEAVDDKYSVKFRETGPAYTLNIQGLSAANAGFHLDVDLVPVIKFLHPKWPGHNYRSMPDSITKFIKTWLVVPKPNKTFEPTMIKRHWRLSFQEFERYMMKNSERLKPTIRMIKKLRDSLQLTEIASYYINTLFFWKIEKEKNNSRYWHQSLSKLFSIMVEELHKAIKDKCIKYFWHDEAHTLNLIEHINDTKLKLYEEKLIKVVGYIYSKDVDNIISCLLTTKELELFHNSEFYKERNEQQAIAAPLTEYTARYSKSKETNLLFTIPKVKVSRLSMAGNVSMDSPNGMHVDKIIKFLEEVGEYLPRCIRVGLEDIVSAHLLHSTTKQFEAGNPSYSHTESICKLPAAPNRRIERRQSIEYMEIHTITETGAYINADIIEVKRVNNKKTEHVNSSKPKTECFYYKATNPPVNDDFGMEMYTDVDRIAGLMRDSVSTSILIVQNFLEREDDILTCETTAELESIVSVTQHVLKSSYIKADYWTVKRIKKFMDEAEDSLPDDIRADLDSIGNIVSAAQYVLQSNYNEADYSTLKRIKKFMDEARDCFPDDIRADLDSVEGIMNAAQQVLKLYEYEPDYPMTVERIENFMEEAGDSLPEEIRAELDNIISAANLFNIFPEKPRYNSGDSAEFFEKQAEKKFVSIKNWIRRGWRYINKSGNATWQSCTDVAQLNKFDDDEEIEW